jgi:predicted nucleic acid-binding Zn ribbon protein
MTKNGKKRLNSSQRRTRAYQIIFVVVSIIVLLSMVLSLINY